MWKMYHMKKLILIVFISLFLSSALYAEKSREISLRHSRQENSIRIVLESADDLIKNANVITSLTTINIEFTSQFELKKQNDFIYETSIKDYHLTIYPKDAVDIKVFKLTAPVRLVIDIKTRQKNLQETAQQSVQKTQKNTIQQTGTKSQPADTQQKAQMELSKTAEKVISLKVLVIDAGHGGYDYGIISQDIKEKDVNLNLAMDLSSKLSKKGLKVFLTRKADQSLSINDRIIFSNSKKPDVFISLHSSSSNKFVIYTATAESTGNDDYTKIYSLSSRQNRHIDKSRTAAKVIGEIIKADFKMDVVLREMPLPILNSMDSPAILIEYPSLKSSSYDQKMRDKLVNSLLKGLLSNE